MANSEGFIFKLYGTRDEKPLLSFMPPLYLGINYIAIRLFADAVHGLRIINIILSTATVPLLYFVGYKLSDNIIIGLLAALALALYPVYIIMAVYPPSLTLNMFLLLGYLAIVVRLRVSIRMDNRLSLFWAIIAGFVLGLCLLTRFMLIGLLPIAILWLWLNCPGKGKRVAGISGLILMFTLLTILPWTVRNYRIHQRLIPISTNGGFVFWHGNNPFTTGSGHEVYTRLVSEYLGIEHNPNLPEVKVHMQPYPMPLAIADRAGTMDELALDAALFQSGLDFIRQNPDKWLALLQAKFIGFWLFRENIGNTYTAAWTQYYKWGYIILILFTIGGTILTRRQWRSYLILYLLFAHYTIFYMLYHVQTRCRWEIETLFFILASAAVWWLFERILASLE